MLEATSRPINCSIRSDVVGHEIKPTDDAGLHRVAGEQEGTALDELLFQSSHYARPA